MSRRAAPRRRLALAAAAVVAAACFDLSGPGGGVASISVLQPAWPSVVVGDTLRDESGAVAPLRVQAFDGSGKEIADAPVQFIVLLNDSSAARQPSVTVDAAGRVLGRRLRGDTLTSDTVLAVVSGLQTPKVTIAVVPRPDSVDAPSRLVVVDTPLTIAQLPNALLTPDLAVDVLHLENGAVTDSVPGWIVRYEIVRSLTLVAGASESLRPQLVNESGAPTSSDTTDARARAARRIRIFPAALPGVPSQTVDDTMVVRASVSFKGQPLRGSPLDFVIPVRIRPRS